MSSDYTLETAMRTLNRRPSASMAEIASAIGISRATLHRQFRSREALLRTIAQRSLDRWEAIQGELGIHSADAAGRDAIDASLERLFEFYVVQVEDFGFLFTGELGHPDVAERVAQLLDRDVAFYAQAQEAGVLRDDVPARWIAHLVFGFMVAARGALLAGDVAPRDFHALVRSSFMDGLGDDRPIRVDDGPAVVRGAV